MLYRLATLFDKLNTRSEANIGTEAIQKTDKLSISGPENETPK